MRLISAVLHSPLLRVFSARLLVNPSVPIAPLSCDLAHAALVNLGHVYSRGF